MYWCNASKRSLKGGDLGGLTDAGGGEINRVGVREGSGEEVLQWTSGGDNGHDFQRSAEDATGAGTQVL